MTNVYVDTVDYQIVHGVKPRGYGHWAFFFARYAYTKDAYWVEGNYADAVREAVKEARRRKAYNVYVGT